MDKQIADIQSMTQRLDSAKRLKVLAFLLDSGVKVFEHADGSRVNLSALEPYRVQLLYECVKSLYEAPVPDKYRI